jgi:hypothetical protein
MRRAGTRRRRSRAQIRDADGDKRVRAARALLVKILLLLHTTRRRPAGPSAHAAREIIIIADRGPLSRASNSKSSPLSPSVSAPYVATDSYHHQLTHTRIKIF